MNRRLAGQTAWISGAASGIGEAIARMFASHGANVILVDVQRDQGEALMAQINDQARADRQFERAGPAAHFFNGDVSQPADIEASIQSGILIFGGLHIIVICAGKVLV